MFKKSKIRDEFDEVFKSGDQKRIKQMLEEHPWLLNEVSEELNQEIQHEEEVIAAVGVMEDELAKPAPLNDIVFCLKVDFNIKKTEEEVQEILQKIEQLNMVQKKDDGWALTKEGGEVCDTYLNKQIDEFKLQ
ncbi:MAG: hypothetical protein EU541_05605 [Promethearchaeota archaeon]|nr:MAG: hypothetical protein EU541_05605 [Candidatus Lokiarchaeota archaeon]